jgi:hypothetical protein
MPAKQKTEIPKRLPDDKKHLLGTGYYTIIKVSQWKMIHSTGCGIVAYGEAREKSASIYSRYGELLDTYEE